MMFKNIPTHVIAGPLGAGKTSLIGQLMAQRPAGERWAVLINEFGQIGLDAALLSTGDDGIALGEVAGGCLCCVNGAPFQVGLGRLLRKARPDRVFIEPSGLGHPAQLLKQLRDAPWRGVLAVQPLIMVLDAQALACGQLLPDPQRDALPDVGLLVINKSDEVPVEKRLWIKSQLPDIEQVFTNNGFLSVSYLGRPTEMGPDGPVGNIAAPAESPATLWIDPFRPIMAVHNQAQAWSMGWRWHPQRIFDERKVLEWLSTMVWRRAKGVVRTGDNWHSFNAVDNVIPALQRSEWRRDSRLELIFEGPQDEAALGDSLRECLIG
ncbi:putative cibalamin biosynthesis-like protein [Pseudomonas sp. M47T1]|nr:putative cibalamin biosynthesis-like protein [Pseudomonas sp. M47T1]